MGCRKLDIRSQFYFVGAEEKSHSRKKTADYTQKTAYSRFSHTVISNYRYYSPELGRWLSRDPIEEDGGWNIYQFVFNNPNYWYDYLGREPKYYGASKLQQSFITQNGEPKPSDKSDVGVTEIEYVVSESGTKTIPGSYDYSATKGDCEREGQHLLNISLIAKLKKTTEQGKMKYALGYKMSTLTGPQRLERVDIISNYVGKRTRTHYGRYEYKYYICKCVYPSATVEPVLYDVKYKTHPIKKEEVTYKFKMTGNAWTAPITIDNHGDKSYGKWTKL